MIPDANSTQIFQCKKWLNVSVQWYLELEDNNIIYIVLTGDSGQDNRYSSNCTDSNIP